MFTSASPWPGPVIFPPTWPTGSHIFANAIAVARRGWAPRQPATAGAPEL
jgi:hypothetical protein